MFGFHFIKAQPNQCILHYHRGNLVRQGYGLAFLYFAPTSSLVLVPVGSVDVPFIFTEVTSDFQEISVQGQITYRVSDPKRISELLNFTLDAKGRRYASDDPDKLPQRLISQVQVLMRPSLRALPLREALGAGEQLVVQVRERIQEAPAVTSLGLEILDLSILAITPTPETARALEAAMREQLLREADEAIYARRNAAVEQERAIKENELNTEIAVENKKRQIAEAQIEAERSLQEKRAEIRLAEAKSEAETALEEERARIRIADAKVEAEKTLQEKRARIRAAEMQTDIELEEKRKELVLVAADNARQEADVKAYGVAAVVKSLAGVDAKVLQALVSAGLKPDQLVALAFRDMAEGADKIGQLSVTPDLLRELIKPGSDK